MFGSPLAGQSTFGSAPAPAGLGQFGAAPPAALLGQPGYGGEGPDRPAVAMPMGQGSYASAGPGQPNVDLGWSPPAGATSVAGWTGEPEAPSAPRSSRGRIIALIVIMVLFVVGVGAFVGWNLTHHASAFTVGACVQQSGSDGLVTDCSTPGSYRIVDLIDTDTCADNQPSLVLTDRVGGGKKWACLVPAN